MNPMIVYSELTERWYVATRYKVLDAKKGDILAYTKYDVTDQIQAILEKKNLEKADLPSTFPRNASENPSKVVETITEGEST